MGIKLDWDIEAEKGKHKQHKEDTKDRASRYIGYMRLLFVIIVFLAVVAGAVYMVYQRWNMVNDRIENLLVETIEAEIATLRIGDLEGFRTIQRSATDAWWGTQQELFNDYQSRKAESEIALGTQILDTEIVEQRARVQIQEIIDGVPYVQTWFYWRYDDGWRHVPPDYTFWGETATLDTERFSIRYASLDELTAQTMATHLNRWLDDACGYLACANLPFITVDIVTNQLDNPIWAANETNAWQMILQSPYRDRARQDMPFDRNYQISVAGLLANRLVDFGMTSPVTYPSDAYYLRSSVVAWMVGRFVQINPEAHLVESLITHYGIETIPALLQNLRTDSNMGILLNITGLSALNEMSLDWRDFVKWRLTTEDSLIQQGDEANWQTFYDMRDSSVAAIAYERFTTNTAPQVYHVLEASRTQSVSGISQLQARVQVSTEGGTQELIVLFNLVNNTWLRVS